MGCSSLRTTGYAAAGAAAGSLLGPGGAAAGAAGGVLAGELQRSGSGNSPGAIPLSPSSSFLDQLSKLVRTLGYWYLLIFIGAALLSKKGRSWFSNFVSLHKTATKKDMDSTASRLNTLERQLSPPFKKPKK